MRPDEDVLRGAPEGGAALGRLAGDDVALLRRPGVDDAVERAETA